METEQQLGPTSDMMLLFLSTVSAEIKTFKKIYGNVCGVACLLTSLTLLCLNRYLHINCLKEYISNKGWWKKKFE